MIKIEELARIFGVKVGEEFLLDDYKCRFVNNNDILEYWRDKSKEWIAFAYIPRTVIIRNLLAGELQIEKIPFKPVMDEEYWFVCISYSHTEILNARWYGCYTDYSNFYAGNCFRTKAEAEDNKTQIINKLKNFYENDGEQKK